MISRDDETILSAYMDGELDADQQQRVESALVASPRLAENLRALSAVRDLVAGLPRDTGADVSPDVMRRIRVASRSQSRFRSARDRVWAVRARRIAILAGTVSAAAGILLMVTVWLLVRPGDRGGPVIARRVTDNVIADPVPGVKTNSNQEPGITIAVKTAPAAARSTNTATVGAEAGSLAAGRHEARSAALEASSSQGDLELSRRILDNPAERRLFLIENGADGKAQQQVASVVERTSRFGYFKITVAQGIVIDPRHPGEATVFAFLVNPDELGQFRDQLKGVMAEVREETRAEPGIVTQLADIGQVQQFAPVPAADIASTDAALALRTRVENADNPATVPSAVDRVLAQPTPEQYRSAPVPHTARTGSTTAEVEQGPELATADHGSRAAHAGAPATAGVSEPISGAAQAPSKPGLASARASDSAKADDRILVFVWVCKSGPS